MPPPMGDEPAVGRGSCTERRMGSQTRKVTEADMVRCIARQLAAGCFPSVPSL